ncbi:Alpha/beta hydrolase domain-containing protein 11 [Galdieria sulphuraria]|uniref:Hydrolase, alpha/beta fold family protein n=1 Tax=Galdieria sulphuraria TaxID=130081 RepID=M2Y5M5_GALSU|nr:hydrolase, alpha/beta fold family protein [Galdieria sulphuraria]EME31154.1 hydrolase, alpha/beta fold family protein [Galdieria sulphuraria]GJD12376.1 Alpha/beta hydrolase domain-containing protein 11 [Galdieria sulphuraria]|eukprot:XP_005707674.1 hydrolase, alpha/beta fold family protein [Galdieria sulphuraria]
MFWRTPKDWIRLSVSRQIRFRQLQTTKKYQNNSEALSTPEKKGGGCVVPLSYYKLEPKKAFSQLGVEAGKPPPLIVLHGILASGNTYRSVLKREDFVPEREIYAVDLRNHGASPHVQEMAYEAMVKDVKCFLEDNGISKACILGHSMGGKVGMQFALENPDWVSELVVVDIAPVTYQQESMDKNLPTEAVYAMARTKPHQCKSRSEIDTALEQQGLTNERVRQFVLTNLIPDDEKPGYYKWRVNLHSLVDSMEAMLSFPSIPAERVFRGPTLFVRGENSPYIQPNIHETTIRKYFVNAVIKTIPHTGHWLISEEPDQFTRLVNEFLSLQK